jgi:DNA-binding response OmpR family regulator
MNNMKKILIVDNDEDLREAIAVQLVQTKHFDVFEAEDNASGLQRTKEALYDLILLDVDLPDMGWRELCRLMRKQGVKCPIIILAAHDSDIDTIIGLDDGANDYVSKPFKFNVLLARIDAQLRQHERSENAMFNLGPCTFKPASKLLITEDEQKVRLTEKETNILKLLYRAKGDVVPRDVLLHEVWDYNSSVTTHTLETHIYRLRQKIERNPSDPRLLITEPGGYRLNV